MSIATAALDTHPDAGSAATRPATDLSRTDPANIDLAVTEPIDISSMIQLLLDRD
jgi:hypothetical protein